MSTEYELIVTNNSSQYQDFCLYQKAPDLGVPDARSLAWLVASAGPGTFAFRWTVDYTFVWGEARSLEHGDRFAAKQAVAADPHDLAKNQIQFDYRDDAFTFLNGPAGANPRLGSLYIAELSAIPPNASAAVGIGMSGGGTFVVPAAPDMTLVFSPHPQYWLTAHDEIEPGQVLDPGQLSNEVEVPFDGTFSMTAVLNSLYSWDVYATPDRS